MIPSTQRTLVPRRAAPSPIAERIDSRGLSSLVDRIIADIEDAIAAARLDVASENLVRFAICQNTGVTPMRD